MATDWKENYSFESDKSNVGLSDDGLSIQADAVKTSFDVDDGYVQGETKLPKDWKEAYSYKGKNSNIDLTDDDSSIQSDNIKTTFDVTDGYIQGKSIAEATQHVIDTTTTKVTSTTFSWLKLLADKQGLDNLPAYTNQDDYFKLGSNISNLKTFINDVNNLKVKFTGTYFFYLKNSTANPWHYKGTAYVGDAPSYMLLKNGEVLLWVMLAEHKNTDHVDTIVIYDKIAKINPQTIDATFNLDATQIGNNAVKPVKVSSKFLGFSIHHIVKPNKINDKTAPVIPVLYYLLAKTSIPQTARAVITADDTDFAHDARFTLNKNGTLKLDKINTADIPTTQFFA